jgi:hypothetical protein
MRLSKRDDVTLEPAAFYLKAVLDARKDRGLGPRFAGVKPQEQLARALGAGVLCQ